MEVRESRHIRLALVEEHELFRTGLRLILERQQDMEVVGDLSGTEGLRELARARRPHAVVFGHCHRARLTGEVEWLAALDPPVYAVILLPRPDEMLLRELLRAGATGVLCTRSPGSELCRAVRTVAVGGLHVDPALASQLAPGSTAGTDADRGSEVSLSDREWAVLRLIALGYTQREIARRLSVSTKTVETYRARVCDKLGLRGRVDIVRFALYRGLLDEE